MPSDTPPPSVAPPNGTSPPGMTITGRGEPRSVGEFHVAFHGPLVVITPAVSVESLQWASIEEAADEVLAPLHKQEVPRVVFDLSRLKYFGTVFLAVLVRCHKLVKGRGGEMALAGPSTIARETLAVTQLDTIWRIFDTPEEALAALRGDA